VSDDALLAEIAELAKRFTDKEATPGTRLYADLGLTGDEADRFLRTFAAQYDVDLSGVIWLRFFDDVPTIADWMARAMVLAGAVVSLGFAARWQAAREAEREITIAHLADVARARVWIEPGDAYKRQRDPSPLVLAFSAMSVLVMAFFLLLGGVVVYAFLTGELGDKNVAALAGIVAVSVLPIFFAFASWRSIQRKLDSA
jgi:hypothetical protein